jgi:hypothetical protein
MYQRWKNIKKTQKFEHKMSCSYAEYANTKNISLSLPHSYAVF